MKCSSALLACTLVALLLVALEYLGLYATVPPRHLVESHWGSDGVNWFGQGPPVAFLFAVVILVLVCGLRYLITARSRSALDAWFWYLLLLAMTLPAVWLLVVFDWDNEAVAAIANWVGTPIMLLAVPTAFLCFDAATATRLPAGTYTLRCVVEVLLLVPLWAVVWAYTEFLLLGWFGP
jgi:hypothetical protein